ncbi:MAG: hypothetical protein EZS28_008357 [Streblomastix strix]|uniref:B30.2/SPRY domain-containing protein n=1 Tax=Streblomastix strix TaxID=222440 RepID=A0A5J4WMU3_9EUKA|nr:MAG: hypothetical protein EZS28_008357 [Streblomastix strix]
MSQLVPANSSVLKDVLIEGNIFTHTKENQNFAPIVFDPAISSGIYKVEIHPIEALLGIGIGYESNCFEQNEEACARGFDRIVYYDNSGLMRHIGPYVAGNARFDSLKRVAMEVNMDVNPRTLTFFVNDVEQKNYVTWLPPSIKFYAYFYNKGAQFKVFNFEKLAEPTAKHGVSTKKYKFGEDWKN